MRKIGRRQRAVVHVSPELLILMAVGEKCCVESTDVPVTARVCQVGWDAERDCLSAIIEDESFAETPEDERFPRLRGPVFKTLPAGEDDDENRNPTA